MLGLLAWLASVGVAGAPPCGGSVAVWDVRLFQGIPADTAPLFAEAITTAVRKDGCFKTVVSFGAMRDTLGGASKDAAASGEEAQLAELAGALGVDRRVFAVLGAVLGVGGAGSLVSCLGGCGALTLGYAALVAGSTNNPTSGTDLALLNTTQRVGMAAIMLGLGGLGAGALTGLWTLLGAAGTGSSFVLGTAGAPDDDLSERP